MSEVSSAPTGAQEIGRIFSYGSEDERVQVAINTQSKINTVTVNEESLEIPGIPGAAEETQLLSALVDASGTLRNRNTASKGLAWSGVAVSAMGLVSIYAGIYAELKTRKANSSLASQESIDFWKNVADFSMPYAVLSFAVGTLSVGASLFKEKVNKRDRDAKLAKVDSALQTHVKN